jgi:hypothetical protein
MTTLADTPAFDRPGISFSTTTLPQGSFAWEQGLPDFQHSSEEGTKSTLYSADTNIRIGLSEHMELQLGTSLFNHLESKTAGVTETNEGYGDLTLALKAALPALSQNLSWALLGAVTLTTGQSPFRAEDPEYDLGTTLNLDINEKYSTALYFNISHSGSANTYTLSPSLGIALTDTLGTYLELGKDFTDEGPDSTIAGGGLTWMATPIVQLDMWADFGLTAESPDLQGGVGVSVFIQ